MTAGLPAVTRLVAYPDAPGEVPMRFEATGVVRGYALDSIGVAALAIGATAIVAAPVLWLLPLLGRRRAVV